MSQIVKLNSLEPLTFTKKSFVINDRLYYFIAMKNTETNHFRLHPYSSYLLQYRSNASKYQSDIADRLVKFLNYCLKNINIEDIKTITIDDIEIYLSNYSQNVSKATYKLMYLTISKFLWFLNSIKILHNISIDDFLISTDSKGNSIHKIIVNVDFSLKSESSVKPLRDFDTKYLIPFIEFCEFIAPEIALGLYFQIFGGLRVSEVTSLSFKDIASVGSDYSHGIMLNLEKVYTRKDIVTGRLSSSKKTRTQFVLNYKDILPRLLKKQMSTNNKDIVFINPTNKLPMTSKRYREIFNKLRKKFIEALMDSPVDEHKYYALYLESYNWSTHIGRGLFSNLVASSTDSLVDIAKMRGDSNLSSALPYMSNSEKVTDSLQKLLDNIDFSTITRRK